MEEINVSYPRKDVPDSVNALFTRLGDLNMVIKNLEMATSIDGFSVWLSKCIQIDKRSTYLYLKKNKATIRPEFIQAAQLEFAEEL